jgi:hypothetical protein
LGEGPIVEFCGDGDEPLGFIKAGISSAVKCQLGVLFIPCTREFSLA